MTFLDALIGIFFSGAAVAMVLYIVSVGLSITMGLLGIANLAHGAFAVAGGYIAYALVNNAGYGFFVGLLAASVCVTLMSVVLERTLYARIYAAGELDQVLLTMGLVFISVASAHYMFGSLPHTVSVPEFLQGQVAVGSNSFSTYRIFLIAFGILIFIALWFGIERTGFGARIRAAVDNRMMAEAVGIDTRQLFSVVFALGSGLAAIGGVLGAEVMALTPGYPLEHLVYFLIVVSMGGLGSVKGPFFSALLLGFGDSACKILIPEFGAFFIYVAVFLLLLARPQGIFGRA